MKLSCIFAWVLAASLVTASLAGCGGWGEDGAPASQTGTASADSGASGGLPVSYAGRIDGLHAAGLVLFDGVNEVTIDPQDRSFQFPASGTTSGGVLSVKVQPSNPSEICTVTGTGVSDAVVTCVYKQRFVYVAVPSTGEVRQFSTDASTGRLTFVRAVAWGAPGANDDADVASIVMHPTRNFLYVVSEQLAQIATYAVDPSNGYLTQSGADFDVPGDGVPGSGAWEKDLSFSPDGSHAYSLDADNKVINHYRVDAATGRFSLSEQLAVNVSTAFEPHFAIDPAGKWVYLVGATRFATRMTSFPINADGTLGSAVESTPPSRMVQSGIDPVRKIAYVTNRVSEGVYEHIPYAIQADGTYVAAAPTPISIGQIFRIDPYDDLIVEWRGGSAGTLASQRITDRATGVLQATGFTASAPYAANVFFSPDGKYVMATSTDVSSPPLVFAIGADGSFTPVAGTPTQFTEVPAAAFGYY